MNGKNLGAGKQKPAVEKREIFLKTTILGLAIFFHVLLIVILSIPN